MVHCGRITARKFRVFTRGTLHRCCNAIFALVRLRPAPYNSATTHRRPPMSDIVITSAVRTPIGSFAGSLSGLSAVELGQIVIAAPLKRGKMAAADVGEVVMGRVLPAACGKTPARRASIKGGVPKEVPAMTIN